MFYNLIMIQWYNKSLCNWSCSFSDMSVSFLLGLLFPYIFFSPKKRKIKVMIKNLTTGRNCQAVILYDSQFTHTIERKRDREREKEKKRYNFHVLKAGLWWKYASVHSQVQGSTIYFVLAALTSTLPDHWPAWRLTSIAVCLESGQIQWRTNHPQLTEADRRPSGHLDRSESTLTSVDSPGEVRDVTLWATQQHSPYLLYWKGIVHNSNSVLKGVLDLFQGWCQNIKKFRIFFQNHGLYL